MKVPPKSLEFALSRGGGARSSREGEFFFSFEECEKGEGPPSLTHAEGGFFLGTVTAPAFSNIFTLRGH